MNSTLGRRKPSRLKFKAHRGSTRIQDSQKEKSPQEGCNGAVRLSFRQLLRGGVRSHARRPRSQPLARALWRGGKWSRRPLHRILLFILKIIAPAAGNVKGFWIWGVSKQALFIARTHASEKTLPYHALGAKRWIFCRVWCRINTLSYRTWCRPRCLEWGG